MSQNEAILKLLTPYGNRQNTHDTYSYPIPWLVSEGKYGFRNYIPFGDPVVSFYGAGNYRSDVHYCVPNLVDQITIINNMYLFAPASQDVVGLLAQNADNAGWVNRSRHGYGMCYQDNYEDKPECRTQNLLYFPIGTNGNTYSKNGDTGVYRVSQRWGNPSNSTNYMDTTYGQTTYKTSNTHMQGMLPVFSI